MIQSVNYIRATANDESLYDWYVYTWTEYRREQLRMQYARDIGNYVNYVIQFFLGFDAYHIKDVSNGSYSGPFDGFTLYFPNNPDHPDHGKSICDPTLTTPLTKDTIISSHPVMLYYSFSNLTFLLVSIYETMRNKKYLSPHGKIAVDGSRNTYDDWKLLAKERPVFAPPEVKKVQLDIPGGNGLLDLTEALSGFPTYDNREGEFEFRVMNSHRIRDNADGTYSHATTWAEHYSEILNIMHGRKMYAVLEDDPEWCYIGRFSADSFAYSGDTWSEITLSYDVNPFKWSITSSAMPWLWDPFNFKNGVILSDLFANITISSETYVDILKDQEYYYDGAFHTDGQLLSLFFGEAPTSPYIIVTESSSLWLRFVNSDLGIDIEFHFDNGRHFVPDFIFYGPNCKLYAKGGGIVSIDFKRGSL